VVLSRGGTAAPKDAEGALDRFRLGPIIPRRVRGEAPHLHQHRVGHFHGFRRDRASRLVGLVLVLVRLRRRGQLPGGDEFGPDQRGARRRRRRRSESRCRGHRTRALSFPRLALQECYGQMSGAERRIRAPDIGAARPAGCAQITLIFAVLSLVSHVSGCSFCYPGWMGVRSAADRALGWSCPEPAESPDGGRGRCAAVVAARTRRPGLVLAVALTSGS
jgi:hypothetical protein